MKHQLKITIDFEKEDFDHDQNGILHNVRVSVDDNVIGCIQDLILLAGANQSTAYLYMSFPDIEKIAIDKSIDLSKTVVPDIKKHIDQLQHIGGVDVRTVNVDDGSPVIAIKEMGTEGYIDLWPMERRWNNDH